MDPTFLILIALMIGLFWFMSRSAKKQRQNIAERQKAAAVPGTWVVTIGGFLGKVVDVDGDVVTLESPSGVETIWTVQAIREAQEPRYASALETDEAAVAADLSGDYEPVENDAVQRDAFGNPIDPDSPQDGGRPDDRR